MQETTNHNQKLPGIIQLNQDIKNSVKNETFNSLLVFDIDNFRKINSDKGRNSGDKIISLIGSKLLSNNYPTYRVGGEEFAIILNAQNVLHEANKLKTDLPLFIHEKTGIKISISGGCVQHPGKEFGNNPKMANVLFAAAEQLLIAAKKQGRDKVLVFPVEPARSLTILNAMVKFYKELARINTSPENREYISITGLPNKYYFSELLDKSIEEARENNHPIALLLLNADSFELIEDSKGEKAAYRYIVDISRILKDVVRSSDITGQPEEKQFAVIVQNIDKKKVQKLAERVRTAVAERTNGEVSIGIYCGPPVNSNIMYKDTVSAVNEAITGSKKHIVIY